VWVDTGRVMLELDGSSADEILGSET
jgi:hypothetical protein